MRKTTLAGALWLAFAVSGWAQAAGDAKPPTVLKSTDAAVAWAELTNSFKPSFPAEWNITPPTEQQKAEFYLSYALALAALSKDFYTKFPADRHAIDTKIAEWDFTRQAFSLGATNQLDRLVAEEKALLLDPELPAHTHFDIRAEETVRAARAVGKAQGDAAGLADFEKGVRVLQKEFPYEPDVTKMLLGLAEESEPVKQQALLREVAASDAPNELKEYAAGKLKKLDSIGKPIEIQFNSVDGRAVDLARMKGKVVLIDFWATWCPPCVASVPEVKATYAKFHDQGFEIVGISLDSEKDKLTSFVASRQMEWPQYFDGLKWDNKFAHEFGIDAVPSMWLVDKKGNLRDMNAREDLGGKVEKLLAEQSSQ